MLVVMNDEATSDADVNDGSRTMITASCMTEDDGQRIRTRRRPLPTLMEAEKFREIKNNVDDFETCEVAEDRRC